MKAQDRSATRSLHEQATSILPAGFLYGAIPLFIDQDTRAVHWTPAGEWLACAARMNRKGDPWTKISAAEAQRTWLQTLRERHPLPALLTAVDVSERTWQGWESSRPMPARQVWTLYQFDRDHPSPTCQPPNPSNAPPAEPAAGRSHEPTKRPHPRNAATRTRST